MNSIFSRVSIRKYQDKPVEKEKIEAILRAAMQAPSAAKTSSPGNSMWSRIKRNWKSCQRFILMRG